jgi:hypothetical protein
MKRKPQPLRIKAQSYEQPPPAHTPGKFIFWEGKKRRVIASTHTHTQLEGIEKAIWNWDLIQRRRKKND